MEGSTTGSASVGGTEVVSDASSSLLIFDAGAKEPLGTSSGSSKSVGTTPVGLFWDDVIELAVGGVSLIVSG